ncbi:DUF3047 domain-containing protein [Chrysiogenes arsenatis]|uniref:DUF3047 domain-containing protein n=1 Tax=Chrysiogenes arsenatis TaxID=309797 RepID=UPI000408907C|nr:DUF3047 domain-containing protein [Chrysiogenes arsenatis]
MTLRFAIHVNVRHIFIKAVFLIALLLLLAPPVASAPPAKTLDFGDQWQEQTFRKTAPTTYQQLNEAGKPIMRAQANGAASGLVYEIDFDPAVYPILKWRWKIDQVLPLGDARTKAGDDYPARVYVVFPKWFKPATQSINYIWANRLPQGEVIPNPFFDNARMVAVRSGNGDAGIWHTECRNIYRDYQAIFGEAPPRAGAIAIMTDADNTGGTATGYYADIQLLTAPKESDPATFCGHKDTR